MGINAENDGKIRFQKINSRQTVYLAAQEKRFLQMYLLGYDIGSSSIKAALVNASDGSNFRIVRYPEYEMPISSPRPDRAEQNPEDWWEAVCMATRKLLAETGVSPEEIASIGIAYQMHGLVVLDRNGCVLRPAIIWCDSRAVEIGHQAFKALGEDYCLQNYLNSPGNFTASKLRWIQENEPEIFEKIDKIMLPGDYIAYRMTGEIYTTISGLSEGVFWDFKMNTLAKRLLEYYRIPEQMIPERVPTFAQQGKVTSRAALETGLKSGIPIGYRAGDQPNNALVLNVLRPGEVAVAGGTSGVVYGVSKKPVCDPEQRVNSFAHVNYSPENPCTGVLLCINGAGSQYRWIRDNFGHLDYVVMEKHAATVPVGAEGLSILPFGNGAERMLGNRNPGARISGIQFNRHEPKHFFRAALEGIAFAFVYGMELLRGMDIPIHSLRAGNDNLFQSDIFSTTIATLVGVEVEVFNTNGAIGAAKAAGVSVGVYENPEAALAQNLDLVAKHSPLTDRNGWYSETFAQWRENLLKQEAGQEY